MAKYFHVSNGLRGCYMPDSAYVLKAETRRELKQQLQFEADQLKDGMVGLSKRAITSLAAQAWREAQKPNPAVLPFCVPYGRFKGDAYYGLFASVATRDEYLEWYNSDNV